MYGIPLDEGSIRSKLRQVQAQRQGRDRARYSTKSIDLFSCFHQIRHNKNVLRRNQYFPLP